MKYYTFEWWYGEEEEEDEPAHPYTAYSSRIKEIENKLPNSVKEFMRDVSMHDSKIIKLDIGVDDKTVRVVSLGYGLNSYLTEYELCYSGFTHYGTTSDPEKGLPGPHGYGDWGYDEFDLCDTGQFMHSVIFSSGIEMTIKFSDFSFKQKPAEAKLT